MSFTHCDLCGKPWFTHGTACQTVSQQLSSINAPPALVQLTQEQWQEQRRANEEKRKADAAAKDLAECRAELTQWRDYFLPEGIVCGDCSAYGPKEAHAAAMEAIRTREAELISLRKRVDEKAAIAARFIEISAALTKERDALRVQVEALRKALADANAISPEAAEWLRTCRAKVPTPSDEHPGP